MRPTASKCEYQTLERVSQGTKWPASSMRSSLRSRKGQGWGFRSHARSSKATEATSGPRTASAARYSRSGFHWQRRKLGEWRRTAINGAGQRKTWGIFLLAVVPFKECTFALLQKVRDCSQCDHP